MYLQELLFRRLALDLFSFSATGAGAVGLLFASLVAKRGIHHHLWVSRQGTHRGGGDDVRWHDGWGCP